MMRAEADKLVGTKVRAATGLNGDYYGTLLRVYGKPWRGEVKVEAVLSAGNGPGGVRMPYAENQVFDAGGSSISPWGDKPAPGTWRETAIAAYVKMREMFAKDAAAIEVVKAGGEAPYLSRYASAGASIHREAAAIVERLKAGEDGRRWGTPGHNHPTKIPGVFGYNAPCKPDCPARGAKA